MGNFARISSYPQEGKSPSEPVLKSREGGTPICDRIRRIVVKYAERAKVDRIP
ncbi:hypothetical protein NIES4073_25700 [Kalymmatonema gypsitolerans NIES-4073]|nr:hypothetical protein NIES4073_25700 [Scytonema sp. NIES-4073]